MSVNIQAIVIADHIAGIKKDQGFEFFRRLLNYTPRMAASTPLKYDVFLDYFVCGEALECHRDYLRLGDQFVKVFTLKEPPAHTFANLLKGLHEIPSNFIVATEWLRDDNYATRRHIQSARRHHHNSKYLMLNYLLTLTDRTPPAPSQMLIDDSAEAFVADLGIRPQGDGGRRPSLRALLSHGRSL